MVRAIYYRPLRRASHFVRDLLSFFVVERGCVEDQPQQMISSAAADAPAPAHSRAPI
jgi:hypothetical protein